MHWIATLLTALAPALAVATQLEVRVRLEQHVDVVEISGYSLRISRPMAPVEIEYTPNLQRAKIRRLKSGVWLVKYAGARTWEPIQSERLSVRGQMLRLGPEPVPYELELVRGTGHGIDVISHMDLDSYLSGVLPSEMPASWPIEALKAQTVAARSFVLRQTVERRNRPYDVDSTVFDQVYKFLGDMKTHPDWGERVVKALRETRGEILLDTRRHILKAFYSADCGCQSEDPKFVWGKSGSFDSVKDPNCGKRAPLKWKLSLDRTEVRTKLIAALGLPSETGLRTLQVAGRTPSGRVRAVVADMEVDGHSHPLEMKSQEFRRVFGFERIQSTDFALNWRANELQIVGKGVGHGVGLCQQGARALAEQGMSYREILKLYYPRAHLLGRRGT